MKYGIHWSSMAAASLLSLGIATAAMAQDACVPRHPGVETVEAGYITAAMTILQPVSFFNDQGVLSGIDGDILAAIAKLECLEVKPLTVDPAAAIQSVVSRRADTPTGGWFRTKARAEIVNLSEPTWLVEMAIWSKDGADTIAGIEGRKIGAVQGDLWVAEAQTVFGDNLTLYPHSVAMQQDLMAGRIDAALQSTLVGIAAIDEGTLTGVEVKPVQPDPRIAATQAAGQINFPVAKENPSLLEAFNDDIKELHANGTIRDILVKYGMGASAADTGEPREL